MARTAYGPMAVALLLLTAARAVAHGGGEAAGAGDGAAPAVWSPALLPLVVLVAGTLLYGAGLLRLWRQAGMGRGVTRARALAYGGGTVALWIALLSPLERMAGELSSAHMVQHMILMLVAAPLLVLGSPGLVFLWALPMRFRRTVGQALARIEGWRFPSYRIWQPLLAWSLYAVALWIWHLPALYQAALRDSLVHDVQHAAFIGTSFLFWRVLLDPLGRMRLSRGVGVLYLFTTSLHACALGVYMALAPRVWYLDYAATAPAWQLTPLEDQQIAGLIMWMPACLVYAVVAAVLLALWLEEDTVRDARCAVHGDGTVAPSPAGASVDEGLLPTPLRTGPQRAHRRGAVQLEVLLPVLGLILTAFVVGHVALRGPRLVPTSPAWVVPGGDPARGPAAIGRHGCGACHVIDGIRDATGRVGPQLIGLREQAYIAGQLPNAPHTLVRWIQNPRDLIPGTAMPNLPVTDAEARDIAAYLYSRP
jgi:putative membrane protein